MNRGSLKHKIYPTKWTIPAIGIIIKLDFCMNITSDIIILTMANDILTPKINVGRVRPTNSGSADNSPDDII